MEEQVKITIPYEGESLKELMQKRSGKDTSLRITFPSNVHLIKYERTVEEYYSLLDKVYNDFGYVDIDEIIDGYKIEGDVEGNKLYEAFESWHMSWWLKQPDRNSFSMEISIKK